MVASWKPRRMEQVLIINPIDLVSY